jgi:hypothetical protein
VKLTQVEREALADIVARAIQERQRAAQQLGTRTNTTFLENLLAKLGGTPGGETRQNHRRADQH